jgi:hypothetical protein
VRPIILLSTLVVKLNLEWFQGLQRPSDIKLWTAVDDAPEEQQRRNLWDPEAPIENALNTRVGDMAYDLQL